MLRAAVEAQLEAVGVPVSVTPEPGVLRLGEAAIRFALSQPDITSALIGLSDLDQLERAIAAAEKGPLLQEALDRLPEVWASVSV